MKNFNEIYLKILKDLWEKGLETSPRGMKIKELINYNFTIDDPKDNIITLKGFETNIKYAEVEYEWYMSGSDRIDFLPLIERTWKKFSDDGVHVNSAYGARIFGRHIAAEESPILLDQWEWVKNKLREDKDSRQAVININSWEDKLKQTKDFPCTMYIQVFIRENKLYWITNIRSTDIFLGVRNDLYCFTKMQQRLSRELKVGLGKYHQHCGSMHLYEKQFNKVKELLEDE